MDLGLTAKIALVAASSKGLGRSCAAALAAEGARVTICARDESSLNATRDTIAAATGADILAVRADMTQPTEIEAVVQQTVDHFGGLHVLVTNAGGPPAGFLPELNDAQWQAAFNLTMMSAVRLIRAALPHQKKAGWGRIINITSMTVKEPVDNLVLSNAIRAAIHGMAKTISRQVGAYGITVNNVMPGYIQTDRFEQLVNLAVENTGLSSDEVIADWSAPIPVGRVGQPDEFGALVAFLASEKAGYLNGLSIPIDGGFIKAAF